VVVGLRRQWGACQAAERPGLRRRATRWGVRRGGSQAGREPGGECGGVMRRVWSQVGGAAAKQDIKRVSARVQFSLLIEVMDRTKV
jgi:hypothetical protein